MSNQNRVSAGVPSGGQFAQSTRGEAGVALAPTQDERVTFEWETDVIGCLDGSSSDGWGSRATIVPPKMGDGENFSWQVKQGGWSWDGRCATLEEAQAEAVSEANRMLRMQESEGVDFDDVDEEDEDDCFDEW